jgi:hypothetical protein
VNGLLPVSNPKNNRSESVLLSDKLSELTETCKLNGIGGVTGTPAVVNGVWSTSATGAVWYISWNATSPSAEDRLTVSQR